MQTATSAGRLANSLFLSHRCHGGPPAFYFPRIAENTALIVSRGWSVYRLNS